MAEQTHWNMVTTPSFRLGESGLWELNYATIGGTDRRGNPLPGDALTLDINSATPRIKLDLQGEPQDVMTVTIRQAWRPLIVSLIDGEENVIAEHTTQELAGNELHTFTLDTSAVEPDTELYIQVARSTSQQASFDTLRAYWGEDDGLGPFDGELEPAGTELETGWTGTAWESASWAGLEPVEEPGEPDPEEPGEPGEPGEPSHLDLGARVIHYLGWSDEADAETLALAKHHAETVTAYAYGYTRGKGFTVADDGLVPAPDLAHVIVAAAAKLTANPEQIYNYSTGDYSERPALLSGWSLMQLSVLNRYRKRWA